VLLPRRDIIVRHISVPGVDDRDLDNAVRLQLDTLHPYPEEEAAAAWVRVGKTPTVLVAITRRNVLEQYTGLFAEAGIKAAAFTVSAAALYSAAHLLFDPPAEGFLATCERDGELEVYGESPTYPVLSATFDPPAGRAIDMAISELRLPASQHPVALEQILPAPVAGSQEILNRDRFLLPYAAALACASPRLAMRLNLLPEEQRAASSRAMFIPTIALAVICLLAAIAVAVYSSLAERRYMAQLQAEIVRLEPAAKKSADLDRAIKTARQRAILLDDVKRRSQLDLDALNELTRLLPPPTWVSGLELTRTSVRIGGESDQAAALLKILDSSPLFENSQFTLGLVRVVTGETFNIRADRKGVPK
jgi:Tfp pilus assembly protein PilN